MRGLLTGPWVCDGLRFVAFEQSLLYDNVLGDVCTFALDDVSDNFSLRHCFESLDYVMRSHTMCERIILSHFI